MNIWRLYEHIQSLSHVVADFKSNIDGYDFKGYTPIVNGEIVLYSYFRNRPWAGLLKFIDLMEEKSGYEQS